MIRLIATDLDGTLLDSTGRLPVRNRRVLQQALEQGVVLALATARKASSANRVAQMLGLECARIIHNGARAFDWSGVELRHHRLPMDLALEVARFADAQGIGLIMTVDEVNYYGGRAAPLNPEDISVPTNLDALVAAPTRMIAVGSEGIGLLCDEFSGAPDTLVIHRYYSRVGALESAVLTHPRASKQDALAELCSAQGIRRDEVLALGDAEADAGMLHWAGIGVAMANGMEEARVAADWIAPTHDEAGLAVAIERFVLSP